MPPDRTHELKIYAKGNELILHLWFTSEHSMQMDLNVALNRPDVIYVELIDCTNHTTKVLLAQPSGTQNA